MANVVQPFYNFDNVFSLFTGMDCELNLIISKKATQEQAGENEFERNSIIIGTADDDVSLS